MEKNITTEYYSEFKRKFGSSNSLLIKKNEIGGYKNEKDIFNYFCYDGFVLLWEKRTWKSG